MFSTPRVPVSLEFFPPKSAQSADKLREVRAQLAVLNARFCSVTYGAGGSTQEGSLRTVAELVHEGEAAAHFTCVNATRDSVREHLRTLHGLGVRRILALRGDLPPGYVAAQATGDFAYASDLVAFVRAETGRDFHIEVACYPETHPQAASPQDDMQAFAAKVRAGAALLYAQPKCSDAGHLRCAGPAPGAAADRLNPDAESPYLSRPHRA